jgi:1-phosphatidylinositol phosphodiesterase
MAQPLFEIVNHTNLNLTRVEVHDQTPSTANDADRRHTDGPLMEIPARSRTKGKHKLPVYGQPRSGDWRLDFFLDGHRDPLSLQLSRESSLSPSSVDVVSSSAHSCRAYVLPSAGGTVLSLHDASRHRWLETVDGRRSLSELTIPGTHESCSRYGGPDFQCQVKTVAQQLQDGIRFFDIRVRHYLNNLPIHHMWVFQHQYFGPDVLTPCAQFLTENPNECIVMSIKEESGSSEYWETIQDTFLKIIAPFQNFWYLGDTIPTLDEVRGRIVLFRRFTPDVVPVGLNLSGSLWKDDATFNVTGAADLSIQDRYKVNSLCDISTKWTEVKHLIEAAVSGSPSTYFLNFSSGGFPTYPANVAKGAPGITGVNSHLAQQLLQEVTGRFGTFAMDFYDSPTPGFLIDMLLVHNL